MRLSAGFGELEAGTIKKWIPDREERKDDKGKRRSNKDDPENAGESRHR